MDVIEKVNMKASKDYEFISLVIDYMGPQISSSERLLFWRDKGCTNEISDHDLVKFTLSKRLFCLHKPITSNKLRNSPLIAPNIGAPPIKRVSSMCAKENIIFIT